VSFILYDSRIVASILAFLPDCLFKADFTQPHMFASLAQGAQYPPAWCSRDYFVPAVGFVALENTACRTPLVSNEIGFGLSLRSTVTTTALCLIFIKRG
jgi:hypothetical protein